MSARATIQCDGCGIPWRESSLLNATQLREYAAKDGWHRQPGALDLCPDCWERRVRFRLVWETYEWQGRTGRRRVPQRFTLPTGWGNGRHQADR